MPFGGTGNGGGGNKPPKQPAKPLTTTYYPKPTPKPMGSQ